MEHWDTIINSQLDDNQRGDFWDALRNHDDQALRAQTGLAHVYWEDIFYTRANKDTLAALASVSAPVAIQVFQGLKDENVSAQSVLDFEAWNQEQKKAEQPYLNFSARYYNAGHQLNRAAFNDLINAFLANLN